ncbi:hypothetical protein ACP0HM_25915 [Escherichia coli]
MKLDTGMHRLGVKAGTG